MAHELDMSNGRANMAYVGRTPWHGLGQALAPDAGLDAWALAAGMSHSICRSRVRFGEGEGQQIWDDQHVLFRNDTKKPLSIVGGKYKIVQPKQILKFFCDLVEANALKMDTAGVLFEGRKYWALARMPENFTLAGGDRVNGYLLLATSCDGSMATTAQITSVRVVCNNTLGLSLGEKSKHAVRVRHSTEFNADQVKLDMGLAEMAWDEFRANAEALSRKRLSKAAAVKILVEALSDGKKFAAGEKIDDLPNARLMGEIIGLYDGRGRGSNLLSADGTAWGLVNAATEFFDHWAGRGNDDEASSRRLANTWFGKNAGYKQDVVKAALEFA